jgi:hypothetical protein
LLTTDYFPARHAELPANTAGQQKTPPVGRVRVAVFRQQSALPRYGVPNNPNNLAVENHISILAAHPNFASASSKSKTIKILNTACSSRKSPMLHLILAQSNNQAGDPVAWLMFTCCVCIFPLIVTSVIFASFWRIFEKAGKPGWYGIIPFYNLFILLEIVGRPVWWFIFFFIPAVCIVAYFIVSIDLAKSFGKDIRYGLCIAFFPPFYLPHLAFSDAKYYGPSAQP